MTKLCLELFHFTPKNKFLKSPLCQPNRHNSSCSGIKCLKERLKAATHFDLSVSVQVPYVKVAPEDILKVHFPRFTTLDLRPTNTDISLAVAGLLTFFNSTTTCLICAQADCKYSVNAPLHLERKLACQQSKDIKHMWNVCTCCKQVQDLSACCDTLP